MQALSEWPKTSSEDVNTQLLTQFYFLSSLQIVICDEEEEGFDIWFMRYCYFNKCNLLNHYELVGI